MQQVFHIAAECFPIAKVGGLADVVGALPKYQNKLGVEAKVIMPFYDKEYIKNINLKEYKTDWITLDNDHYEYTIYSIEKSILGFEVFLIKIFSLTDRENVYGYGDDVERFLTFSIISLKLINSFEKLPSIIHCHDHHTGFIPFFCSYAEEFKNLRNTPTITTIHNAQYQGDFGYDKLNLLPKFDHKHIGLIDWYGRINPLATAIKCAWKVSTVSPTYAKELMVKPSGLEHLLASEHQKCLGILNGIDTLVWNPETDTLLHKNFNYSHLIDQRIENKNWICTEFNFNKKLPIIAFIGRFVYEKGSDLLAAVIRNIFDEMKLNVSILILGSGNKDTEHEINNLKHQYKGKFNCHIGYNEKLSHIIYGGTDFLLMPSRVEPCGLNQMYALKYGAIPITSNNGGLNDTVFDIEDKDNGVGLVFNEVTVSKISDNIKRAEQLYRNNNKFYSLRQKIMKIDYSWDKSAQEYINMYKSLTKNITVND